MSASINLRDVEEIINSLVKKGVEYAVALYPFFFSFDEERYRNVVETIRSAFGEDVAEKVYREITEAFKNINFMTEVIVKNEKIYLRDYLQRYILKEDMKRIILNEIENRFNRMSEEDRKILSIASALINVLKRKSYSGMYIDYPSYRIGGISVSSTEIFSRLVSSILRYEISDVRRFFYKYILGFQGDYSSRRYYTHALEIYPFAIPYIEKLASKIFDYIKIPDKSKIRSILEEMYQRGEYIKIALIDHSLEAGRSESQFLSYFSGLTFKQLCKEVVIENMFNDCFVNPLVYEEIREAIKDLYNKALDDLIKIFREIFERQGYRVGCANDHCAFARPGARPIHVFFYPWPKSPPYYVLEEIPGAVKSVVMQGIPTQLILQTDSLRSYGEKGYLWFFIERDKILIVSNTYKHEDHYELLRILKDHFFIETIGSVPKELEESLTSLLTKPAALTQPVSPPQISPIKRFGGRDLLEDIVASVLYSLGFTVKVDHKIVGKAGTEIEVDVWGEKYVGDIRFIVYASCKNWDKPVEISIVREEFGRILQLPLIPHVRVIVAPSFTEPAKKEAIADGFVVIETGERAVEDNMNRIYKNVYDKLNKLFIGVAPKWMQELAERARKVAEEIRKIGEELEKIAGTPS